VSTKDPTLQLQLTHVLQEGEIPPLLFFRIQLLRQRQTYTAVLLPKGHIPQKRGKRGAAVGYSQLLIPHLVKDIPALQISQQSAFLDTKQVWPLDRNHPAALFRHRVLISRK